MTDDQVTRGLSLWRRYDNLLTRDMLPNTVNITLFSLGIGLGELSGESGFTHWIG